MSQEQAILRHLESGKRLSPLAALTMFNTFRLAARIAALRKAGHDIRTYRVERNGKSWAEYGLAKPKQEEYASQCA